MSLNEQLWREAERLAARGYDIATYRESLSNGNEVIIAKHPELPGCIAHGATVEGALADLREARTEYIYSLLEDRLPVPSPRGIATGTIANKEYTAIVAEVIIGFGSAQTQILDTEENDKNAGISPRGDLTEVESRGIFSR